jgi:hypothetical protein
MPFPIAAAPSTTKNSIVPLWFVTQGGGSAVTNFNSIPQGYQDLIIVTNGFYTGTAGTYAINADGWTDTSGSIASSPCSNNGYYGWNNGAQTYTSSNAGLINLQPQGVALNQPHTTIVHILNYASTTQYKTVLVETACDVNGTTAGVSFVSAGSIRTLLPITGFNISTYNGLAVWSNTSVQAVYGIKGPKQ